jgi:quinol monooxygenase YgiN
MYAVCVTFQLKQGRMAAFMPLVLENAKISRNQEPECHQFDVLSDSSQPDAVHLYELYTDRAAFDVHLASAHFKTFDAAVGPMIADKFIKTWDKVTQ